jgi:cytidylate kinase
MNANSKQTVVLFSGLPYSGKTAIIQRLLEKLPGEAVYVDGIFRDIVSEEEVCLERWLEEGTRLVDGIIEQISNTDPEFWENSTTIIPEEPLIETIKKLKLQTENNNTELVKTLP